MNRIPVRSRGLVLAAAAALASRLWERHRQRLGQGPQHRRGLRPPGRAGGSGRGRRCPVYAGAASPPWRSSRPRLAVGLRHRAWTVLDFTKQNSTKIFSRLPVSVDPSSYGSPRADSRRQRRPDLDRRDLRRRRSSWPVHHEAIAAAAAQPAHRPRRYGPVSLASVCAPPALGCRPQRFITPDR